MKLKFTKINRTLFIFLAMILFLPEVNYAEEERVEITAGKEYWLGIPHCRKEDNEPHRGDHAMVIWLSSQVETKATIYADAIGYAQTFRILPNQTTEVPMVDQLMHKESETVKDNGIYIKANDPISVAVYLSYKWSGEAYRVIPLEWLGKDYVTLNMYLDKTDKYKPPQILIIATEDGTKVTYRPTANTELVNRGGSKSVSLRKGQTYLIEGKIEPGLIQDWASDLSGTQITSNKRIAVLSGHTKGAFPRYSYTMLGRPANFMRNMLIDMVWPNSICGTEYISAPIKYANRPRPSTPPDNKGDLIRLVAIEDETDIMLWNGGLGTYQTMRVGMKKGQYYDFTNQENAAMYKTSKPVLAGQYGKTWWLGPVSPSIEEVDKDNGDEVLNPSRNGQGMLVVLAPKERWTSYASFRSPYDIDNFVYVTFDFKDKDNLYFDGQKFTAVFGQAYGFIEGTTYAYFTEQVSAGDHFISGENGAKFAGYAYGNWDRSKDGFAYGYPIGINFAIPCEDSLVVIDTMICGDVEATASSLPEEAECAGIYNIWTADKLENYIFEVEEYVSGEAKKVKYYLYVEDIRKEARATIIVMTKSGLIESRTYEYLPEQIEATPNPLHFGILLVNESKTLSLTLHNPGKIVTHVEELKLKYNRPEYVIDVSGIPVDIQPDESVVVDITATALKEGPVEDSVIAVLSCYEDAVTQLKHTTSTKLIFIEDAHFGNVKVGKNRTQAVGIRNTGPLQVTSTDLINEDREDVFSHDLDTYFPLVLETGESMEFNLTYTPITPNEYDEDITDLVADTKEEKTWSEWTGNGIDADLIIDPVYWEEVRVMDGYEESNVTVDGGYIQKCKVSHTIPNGNELLNVQIQITDNGGGVFSLVNSNLEFAKLAPGDSYEFDVLFTPTDHGDFTGTIKAITTFVGERIESEAALTASAGRPRIDYGDYDFGIVLENDISNYEFVSIRNMSNDQYDNHDWKLEVFDNIRIIDNADAGDASAFEIDPSFFTPDLYPFYLYETGDANEILVPIRFKPTVSKAYSARLVCNHDAPLDIDAFGLLQGQALVPDFATTDYYFGKPYYTLSTVGTVTFTNNGTVPLTMQEPLLMDEDATGPFVINRSWVGTDETQVSYPYDLQPGNTLTVELTFTTNDFPRCDNNNNDGLFADRVQYNFEYTVGSNTTNGSDYSVVTGDGKVHRSKISIPVNYKVKPGLFQEIEVSIEKSATEIKPLQEAEVYEFTINIEWPDDYNGDGLLDFLPYIHKIEDIKIGQNSVLQGWEITADNIDSPTALTDMLTLTFTNIAGVPLQLWGTDKANLFSFSVEGMLASNQLQIIHPTFSFDNYPYMIPEQEDGDIFVEEVCVNDLRQILVSDLTYSLSTVAPNPVSSSTTISYSIAWEGHVQLDLFNTQGEKVAVLVNMNQSRGAYELDFDVHQLGLAAGTYYYRIKSGAFEETRKLIVVK